MTSKPPEKATGADSTKSVDSTPAAASGEPTIIRKRKRKKKNRGLRRAVIVAVVLIVLGAGTAFGVNALMQSGASSFQSAYEEAEVEAVEEAITSDGGKTVSYNGHNYALNEDIVSVLVIGFDRTTIAEEGEATGQADALMLMAFDTVTGEVNAIGIPRDTMVTVDTYRDGTFTGQQTMQACLAFNYGNGQDTSCENMVRAAARAVYNIPISYYFALDESGLPAINDAIGGVALTPLYSIPGTNIEAGVDTVLFGTNALRYVQYRDITQLDSSLQRQERQTQYVRAFASQALSQAQGNLGILVDLFNTAGSYSVTNLGVDQFSYLASAVLQSGVTDISLTTLPGEMVQGGDYAEYHLDETGTYETVLDVFYTQQD